MNNQGERIKTLRKTNKLSQEQFAASLNVSPTLISKIEHGKTPVTERLLQQISLIYNVNIDWLLGNSPEMGNLLQENAFEYSSVNIQKSLLNSQMARLISLSDSLNSSSQKAYFNFLKELLSLIEETFIMIDNAHISPDSTKEIKNLTDFFCEKYGRALNEYTSKLKY